MLTGWIVANMMGCRPNGCSFLNLPPGEVDLFVIIDDEFNFKGACNIHDSCYYTLNSNRHVCNKLFLKNLTKECSHGTEVTRLLCMARAKTFYGPLLRLRLLSILIHRP